MSKTILFSPIGGTDPISQNNLHDGAMLHICRVYHPDEVYLYMSQEMLKNQAADDRYRYCLNHLMERENFKMDIHEIERPELTNVHLFDFFYEEFHKELEKLTQKHPDDRILINVSSGSPAMKSGLLVLVTLGEFDCEVIQVATPARRMNEHTHKGFDVELAWELDEDNQPEHFQNRCKPVKCPTLSMIKQEENIKKLLDAYDYYAALQLAESLPESRTSGYLPYLEMAHQRQLLDNKGARKIEKQHPLKAEVFSVKNDRYISIFEYMLDLEIKQRQGKYADFIRALSPLINDLFWMILEDHCGIKKEDYCRKNKKKKMWQWDDDKMPGSEIADILTKNNLDTYGPIYSTQLEAIICEKSQDASLNQLVSKIRDIERKIRNQTAHEIISLSDKRIKEKTGESSADIVELLKKAFKYTGMKVSKQNWYAYDVMNEAIKEKISEGNFDEKNE